MRKLSNACGVTLVEMMTIAVLIGIISAMAMPHFDATIKRLKFRTIARHMLSDLRLARSLAISNKQQIGVCFNADLHRMTLFLDRQNPTSFSFETGDSVIKVDSLPRDFVYCNTTFGNPSIVYRPNGSASSTGYLHFMAYDNSDYMFIGSLDVLASTGRTKMGQLYMY